MLIIGIDPGLSGGIAIIPLYHFIQTKIYPLEKYSIYDLAGIFEEIRNGSSSFRDTGDGEHRLDTTVEVFLEEPSLNPYLPGLACPACKKKPMRNSQSFAKLGRSLGQLEGLCKANRWTVNCVSPQRWQKALGCMTGGDKRVTREHARKIFPFLSREQKNGKVVSTITDATADATLIALYGYLQYANPQYLPSTIRRYIPATSLPKSTPTPSSTLKGKLNELLGPKPRPRGITGSGKRA